MPVPAQWRRFQSEWSESDTSYDSNLPQILLGMDLATLHPVPVLSSDNSIIQTNTARLLKSVLTGKYLATGHMSPVTEIVFCDTDKDVHQDDPLDLPLNGDESPEPPLMHIRAVRSSIRTPDEDDILTLDSDSDSDSDSETAHQVNFHQVTAQMHCIPSISVPTNL